MKTINSALFCCSLFCLPVLGSEPPSINQKQPNDLEHIQYPHFYLGGRLGWSFFQDACSNDASDCNDDMVGGGFYIGYQFNHWFAIEGGITDYGEPNATYNLATVSADVYGKELSGKFSYPLSSEFTLFSRLGGSYLDVKKVSSWAGKQNNSNWNALASIGVDYSLSPDWSLRAEYQFIDGIGGSDTLKSDLHFTSIGFTYRFGQKTPPELVATVLEDSGPASSQLVKPTATPKPIILGSDGLFDIDSHHLKYTPELTALAEKLTHYSHGLIYITGYTDSSGSKVYNQRLSEQRAIAISEYFKRMGIEQQRLNINAKGEGSPVADNKTVEGRKENRRVEIRFEVPASEENNEGQQ
ncbi:outer membrane beta-barrel protein [Vibrio sp. TH_r3]|uniref:OmpA family protein n=1 Tax=Vibrio sp. TH_r3 TaxID=3082084 RepID=UPI002955CFD5|nr:OmpA family protein [Vibrio sp. TH_r3]MDV7104858.1 outer membrane beta-barrel protein [Vibrio sp. TH_r3]